MLPGQTLRVAHADDPPRRIVSQKKRWKTNRSANRFQVPRRYREDKAFNLASLDSRERITNRLDVPVTYQLAAARDDREAPLYKGVKIVSKHMPNDLRWHPIGGGSVHLRRPRFALPGRGCSLSSVRS